MRLDCVLLASGYGSRFGRNKLLYEFRGRSLLARTLDSLPPGVFGRVFAVTQYDEVERLCRAWGAETVRNSMEDPRLCRSLALGLGAADRDGADGCMFCVCDQPLRRRESVLRTAETFLRHPDRIVFLSAGGSLGNPVVFPREFYPELYALQGDRGGSAVARLHPDRLLPCEAQDPLELKDTDTLEDLLALEARKSGAP